MNDGVGKPILVTGAHRSGTTWVGKTLATSPKVGYIDEPFSPVRRHYDPGTCNAKFDHWWMYVTKENEAQYYDHILATLEFRYKIFSQLARIVKNRCGVRTFLKGYSGFILNHYVRKARPLFKDPIALFSTEWLAERFGMDVVVLIRHPAAFVSSIKRMYWTHDFNNFLQQPLLMRDHLFALHTEIREHTKRENDIVDDAILIWKMFYHFIDKMQKNHREFIFIRHEDLSRKPVEEFKKLFDLLNIEFNQKIEKTIIKYSNSSNPSEAQNGVEHQLKRNSVANINNWKHRLTNSEIERIRENTKEISHLFYNQDEW
jgi:hypothetical protein